MSQCLNGEPAAFGLLDVLSPMEGHTDSVLSVAFSPDGSRIASGDDDKNIKLWSASDGMCIATLKGQQDEVRSVIFSPDGSTFASSAGYNIQLWWASSGQHIATLARHNDFVNLSFVQTYCI